MQFELLSNDDFDALRNDIISWVSERPNTKIKIVNQSIVTAISGRAGLAISIFYEEEGEE